MNKENNFKNIFPLVYVKRGKLKEKVYHGVYVIIDENGKILHKYGDYNYITYSRSTAKPFQTLPLILSGAFDYFKFDEKELSLMCSSHFGEEFQIEVLKSIMNKAQIIENDLLCPITYSRNREIREIQKKKGLSPSKLYSDCSAKHSQMIAYCKYKVNVENKNDYIFNDNNKLVYDKLRNKEEFYNYKNIEHPLQIDIRKILSIIYETEENKFYIGIDGCGVPVFSSSILNMAKAYLKLIAADLSIFEKGKIKKNKLDEKCKKSLSYSVFEINRALSLIRDSMIKYPEMIAGTNGLCSLLTKIFNGNGVAKVGADGVYCLGIKVLQRDNSYKNIGIALKIIDGNYEISEFAIVNILRKHGFLEGYDFSLINNYIEKKNFNERGEYVGEYGLCF